MQINQFTMNDPSINHRRTHSNNLELVQGINLRHRRAISNATSDFGAFNNHKSPLSTQQVLSDSLNSPEKSPKKSNRKGFTSLLNAALTYFDQESEYTKITPNYDLDLLKKQKEKLLYIQQELENSNLETKRNLEECKEDLKIMQLNRKEFENSVSALKQYSQQLEKTLNKAMNELKFQQKHNEEINASILQQELEKNKGKSMNKVNPHKQELEKPTPKPITYKPLSQRSLRNSRDLTKTQV